MTAKSDRQNTHVEAILRGVFIFVAHARHPDKRVGIAQNTAHTILDCRLGLIGIDYAAQPNVIQQGFREPLGFTENPKRGCVLFLGFYFIDIGLRFGDGGASYTALLRGNPLLAHRVDPHML